MDFPTKQGGWKETIPEYDIFFILPRRTNNETLQIAEVHQFGATNGAHVRFKIDQTIH